jgi:hypothetical protein
LERSIYRESRNLTLFLKKNVYLWETEFFAMLNCLKLLLCVFAFLFLAACVGSQGGGAQADGRGAAGKSGTEESAVPKADDIKKARDEATSLTEENHKLAREIFDLKHQLGEE